MRAKKVHPPESNTKEVVEIRLITGLNTDVISPKASNTTAAITNRLIFSDCLLFSINHFPATTPQRVCAAVGSALNAAQCPPYS